LIPGEDDNIIRIAHPPGSGSADDAPLPGADPSFDFPRRLMPILGFFQDQRV